jgi:hypothetical protein
MKPAASRKSVTDEAAKREWTRQYAHLLMMHLRPCDLQFRANRREMLRAHLDAGCTFLPMAAILSMSTLEITTFRAAH